MISLAILRYPYLRVLTLSYMPPGTLSTAGSMNLPTMNRRMANLDSQVADSTLSTSLQSTSLLSTTPTSSCVISGSVLAPSSTPMTANTTTNMEATVLPKHLPLRSDSLKPEQDSKALSPPEQAYIRQWTKHCVDLRNVVFLSGREWSKGRTS